MASNMKIISTIDEMQKLRCQLPEPVGFVPTMGYLHEGHLTLVRQAKAECACAVTSIFVNPTQFGPKEDFGKYPRDPQHDVRMLEEINTDVLFMPPASEMYPPGFNTWVDVEKVTDRLEGERRPGHFRGVATVCNKLFNIVRPAKAYFGQKDAQQCVVIKKMVADLNMPLEIVIVPTVREAEGLALSSRNVYLSPEQRQAAVVLSQSLKLAEKMYREGERDAAKIRRAMEDLIKRQPLGVIDYISIADGETLEELVTVRSPAVISLVVKFGRIRLLDNVVV